MPAMVAGLLMVVAGVSGAQPDVDLPVIGTIEILTHEVFEESAAGLTAPYRVANKLHVRTRDSVVARELLFDTGDSFDVALLEQTERNLRVLPFFREARVETLPVDEDLDGHIDRVDVRVTTWDRWSLAPRFDLSQVQGHTLWEVGASEKNLFGFGKAVSVSHRVNLDRSIDRVLYDDYQFAGSNVGLTASVAKLSDGHEQFLLLDREYLSLQDPWMASVQAGSFNRSDRLFENGTEVSRLRHRGRWGDVVVGRALRRSQNRAVRMHGAYRLRKERIGSGHRDFGTAEVGVQVVSYRFVRLTHVNQFERVEDINLGAESYGTVGLSSAALGGQEGRVVIAGAGHSQAFRWQDDHFALGDFAASGRQERDGWRNAQSRVRLRYLRKHSLRHVLVGRGEYRYGHRLDPEVQLLLGAETGLRGYPVRQFAGNRSLLLSVEERWFMADDVGQLVSLGLAAFLDSGYVWPETETVDLADLKTGIGVSLLLGSNRLSSRGGVRFDLGYGLSRIPGADRWVFAAGSDLRF